MTGVGGGLLAALAVYLIIGELLALVFTGALVAEGATEGVDSVRSTLAGVGRGSVARGLWLGALGLVFAWPLLAAFAVRHRRRVEIAEREGSS